MRRDAATMPAMRAPRPTRAASDAIGTAPVAAASSRSKRIG